MRGKIIVWFVLLCTLYMLCVGSAIAEESERQTIRVGIRENSIFFQQNAEGEISGYYYSYLNEIKKYVNWDYEYKVAPMDELLEMAKKHEIDLVLGVPYKKSNLTYFDFPKYMSGFDYTTISTRKELENVDIYAKSTYDGTCIGILKNDPEREMHLDEFLEISGFQLERKYYNNMNQLTDALLSGKVDYMLSASEQKPEGIVEIYWMHNMLHFIAVSKGNKGLLDELNLALKKMREVNPDITFQYFHEYIKKLGHTFELTQEEKDYINQKVTLRVVYDKTVRPLAYQDEDTGAFRGAVAYMFQTISEDTGINFEYIKADGYMQALEMIRDGKADICASVFVNYSVEEEYHLKLTPSYLSTQTVIIKQKKLSLRDALNGIKAVSEGYYTSQENMNGKILYFNTLKECVKAVNSGQADYTLINSYMAQAYTSRKYTNLSILPKEGTLREYAMGISDDLDVNLYCILSKWVETQNKDDMQNAIYKDMMEMYEHKSISDYIYDHPMQSMLISMFMFITVFLLGLGTILMRQKNIRVQKNLREQQLYEKNLLDALIMAEEANFSKTQFLSNMSHEIRTPLNGIIGMTSIALCEQKPSRVKECLQKIEKSSNFLLSLVDDILDISKIERHQQESKLIPMDLYQIVDDVSEMIMPQIDEKSQMLSISYRNVDKTVYLLDKTRLTQVLLNLLSNSIKYTNIKGKVNLLLERKKIETFYDYITFRIKDNGIGMSKEFLEKVFQPFTQEYKHHEKCGSGLGLSITKNLVNMLDGDIHIKSKVNEGTQITLSFRLKKQLSEHQEDNIKQEDTIHQTEMELSKKDFHKLRALVVDDNDINLEIAAVVIQQLGLKVEIAMTGEEAINLYQKNDAHYFDIIFMDIRLPKKDGYEVTRLIRECNKEDAKSIVIIAMTANAFDTDVSKSLGNGMNEHISKPISKDKIIKVLNKFF